MMKEYLFGGLVLVAAVCLAGCPSVSGGTLSGLSAFVAYTSGSDWLSTSFSGTAAPATLTVVAHTSSLTAGSYGATIFVLSGGVVNSPQTVSVAFTVAATGPIVGARFYTATGNSGDHLPIAQALSIGADGTWAASGGYSIVTYLPVSNSKPSLMTEAATLSSDHAAS